METFLIKAAQLILAFAILVIVHEFGHYLFSRIFGVKVEKFYLFFNPWFTLWKYKPKPKEGADEGKASWRDTEYGIGWLPLGGYCKIAGMIDESMDKEQMKQPAKPWEFRSKPAWQRLLIMVGGVLFNFILAIVIYAGMVYAWGEQYITFRDATEGMEYCSSAQEIGFRNGDIPLAADGEELTYLTGDELIKMLGAKSVTVLRDGTDTVAIDIPENFIFKANAEAEEGTPFMMYRYPVVIADVQPGMGAKKAGLQKLDKVVAVDTVKASTYTEFTAELNKYAGKTVPVMVLRDGKQLTVNAEIDGSGKLGILLAPITEVYNTTTREYSLWESVPRGIALGVDKLSSYVSQMKYVFTSDGVQQLGGFGAIGSIFPEKWNWEQFWSVTAFLSVILAFMNILPIPALDGGHVLFLLYEIIARRQPSEKFLEHAQVAGMAFLFLLLIYANGNDIYRYFFK